MGTLGVSLCVFALCVRVLVSTTLSVTLLPVELRNRRLEEARRCFVQSWSQDQKGPTSNYTSTASGQAASEHQKGARNKLVSEPTDGWKQLFVTGTKRDKRGSQILGVGLGTLDCSNPLGNESRGV